MHYRLFFLFSFLFCTIKLSSQLAPGEWRDHLPYKIATKTVVAGDKIYCCTLNSLYYTYKTETSFNPISKVQGLTETSIATIDYSADYDLLIIVYTNLNIDFLQGNKIINFPYIKNKSGLTNKKINEITIYKNKAYLSCGFGIVVIDVEKMIVLETYFPSIGGKTEPIIDLAIDENYIYAASENNIFRGFKNDLFLVDNSRWELLKNFNTASTIRAIESFNNKLFVLLNSPTWASDSIIYFDGYNWQRSTIPRDELKSMTVANSRLIVTGSRVYQLDAALNLNVSGIFSDANFTTCDPENTLWIADGFQSIIRIKNNNEVDTIKPNSPTFVENVKVDILDNQIWTVAGNIDNLWQNEWSNHGFAGFYNNTWHAINRYVADYKDMEPYDFVNVKINPFNPSQIYFATWSSGLVLFENNKLIIYNESKNNSTIQENIHWGGRYFVYGLAFDDQQNLWITNSRASKPLSVKKKDGKWKSFSLPFVSTNYYMVGDIIVTSWGQKWITNANTTTMVIFDENNTIDNETDDLTTTMNLSSLVKDENALLASNYIYCITEDREGNIWVGTDAGPVEISGAQNVFDNGARATKIKVPLTTIGEDYAAFLLETERINAITVDGGSRKWIGTQSSGAYLVSPDGTKQIIHFTAENSPLLSNTVLDIDIDPKTGEIFFATDKGLISYRGYSTEGSSEFGDVYVFPNPVREDFDGDIIVTNLLTDANVKITDISGNLVFETNAVGGQATWNGKNLLGKRVNTGVYLVFCSNNDGTKTFVSKLLFIH